MCGFTGYLLKQSTETSISTIDEMLQLQKHRGPDDSGIIGVNLMNNSISIPLENNFQNQPNLIWGFNRLSILDLSAAGHQPMLSDSKDVALMMNGEVYNAFDYKDELINLGFSFRGKSDTEVVLNLYLAFGLDGMLSRLNGMFAIAIYDSRFGNFYLVRDRLGIKPLYILQKEDLLAFSSEMKSFKALPNFKFELDDTKISEFLIFRNSINKTLFKNIINLEPGTYCKISHEGKLEYIRYFDLTNYHSAHRKFESFDDALDASVKRQMISDVKLGCQLSGGVDSSLVAAKAKDQIESGKLECVSVIFKDPKFSEKNYIDQVVNKLLLKSHQVQLDAENYLSLINEATWHFEQPLNHPNTIGIKLLSKEARKHVTVLLSGEGADESFGGYSRFNPKKTRLFSKNIISGFLKNRKNSLQYLNLILRKSDRYILQTAYGSVENASLLFPRFSINQAFDQRRQIFSEIAEKSDLKKRKYELMSYLPDLLMRQDKMSMAHSIENRVPFLDNEMLDFALTQSEEDLYGQFRNKWEGKIPLKESCSAIFGKDFSYRSKMGFGIPLKSFFQSEVFQERWKSKILPGIEKRGMFNVNQLDNWMKSLPTLNAQQIDSIWLMVGFEIWATQYLD